MRARSLLLAGEVALAAVTLAVVLGMSRLFEGGSWLGPLAVNAVAAHAVAALCRRAGLSLPVGALLMTAGAVLVASWTSYWSTTALGVPTGETWAVLTEDLGQAWTLYQDVVAPAPVEPGFVVASSLALWCIAYVADWAAFRLWVPFEATLPAGTLFLFTALLGVPRGRGWAVALYAATFMSFLLLHRLGRQATSSHWVADRRVAGQRASLVVGAALGLVAVVAGSTLGPALPGADAPGLVDPRELRGDDQGRVTVSPLVDIQSRLLDQANVEVFEVRSPRNSYWRLTSLDQFDGVRWTSKGGYDEAGRDLPSAAPFEVPVDTFEQQFTISALAAIWLPTAFEPRALRVSGVDVLYEDRSSTLVVETDVETSNGLVYQVTSTSPRPTAEDLAGAAGEVPDDIRDRFLELPDDFSPDVQALAESLTRGAATPYAAALALQDHLRTFTYDLEVRSGHSEDVLEEFLFVSQRGYCEQFAGSFAALARAAGLPARVAVGFTQGETDPAEPGVYRVRGEHAHAWPEVYLAGAGWLAFEPTPGRGIPFAESYTGVTPAQAASGEPETATTVAPTAVPTTVASGATPARPDFRDDQLSTGGGSDPEALDDADDASAVERLLLRPLKLLVPVALAMLAAYALVVPLAVLVRRRRRRGRATGPADRVALAWLEAAEESALAGYHETASDTPAERADRLSTRLPSVRHDIRALAALQEVATYSSSGVGEQDAAQAEQAAEAIKVAARQQATLRQRVLRWLDPRPWIAGAWSVRASHQRHITTTVRADLEAERELVGSRR